MHSDGGASGKRLRDRQLLRCCDALDQVDPDAPTLCEGWTAHDLAVHLWAIKHDPLSWPGIAVPAAVDLTRRRAAAISARWSYAELIDRLRRGSGGLASMPLDVLEGHRHALGEYYVHTQDVARPAGLVQPEVDAALAEALWLRAVASARALRRRLPAGLVLVHPDGRTRRVGDALPEIRASGAPGELLCWVYGRRDVADVAITPDP